MTDLEQFLALLVKAKANHNIRTDNLHSVLATKLVEVELGSRCHFEAEFDDDDNIVSIGQWDEM